MHDKENGFIENGFIKKVKLWERTCENGHVSLFPLLDVHLAIADVDRSPVVKMVKTCQNSTLISTSTSMILKQSHKN